MSARIRESPIPSSLFCTSAEAIHDPAKMVVRLAPGPKHLEFQPYEDKPELGMNSLPPKLNSPTPRNIAYLPLRYIIIHGEYLIFGGAEY